MSVRRLEKYSLKNHLIEIIIYFDSHAFTYLVPAVTQDYKKKLCEQITQSLAQASSVNKTLYIAHIFREVNGNNKSSARIDAPHYRFNQFQLGVIYPEDMGHIIDITINKNALTSLRKPMVEICNIKDKHLPKEFATIQETYQKNINIWKEQIAKRVLSSDCLLSSDVKQPALPINIYRNNFMKNLPLIEKRFDFSKNSLFTAINKSEQIKKQFNLKIFKICGQYAERIKSNLNLLAQLEQQALQQDNMALRDYITRNVKPIISGVAIHEAALLKKALVKIAYPAMKDFETKKFCLLDTIKQNHFANACDRLIYIKTCLVYTLYESACAYLKLSWQLSLKLTNKLVYRKNKAEKIKQQFQKIAYANELGNVFQDKQMLTLINTPLAILQKDIANIRKNCNSKYFLSGNKTTIVKEKLTKLNDELKTKLKLTHPPFIISGKNNFSFSEQLLTLEADQNQALHQVKAAYLNFRNTMVNDTEMNVNDLIIKYCKEELMNLKNIEKKSSALIASSFILKKLFVTR